ncbi:telomere-protecting terminal protein Tpg [Streptomyces aurantiacus]|uniref:telomere-protecting terminal protein Tpg n=1 Tax=Streptomyces aurantiacus TaxID=47760 RepID=UPI003D318EAD
MPLCVSCSGRRKGSTKNVAVLLGISQRTVQRWVTTRPGMRRRPSAVHAGLIDEAVRARWQPLVRARLRARTESDGFVFHTRARFGFAAPAGSSDDPRVRLITQYLSEKWPASCSPPGMPAGASSSRW